MYYRIYSSLYVQSHTHTYNYLPLFPSVPLGSDWPFPFVSPDILHSSLFFVVPSIIATLLPFSPSAVFHMQSLFTAILSHVILSLSVLASRLHGCGESRPVQLPHRRQQQCTAIENNQLSRGRILYTFIYDN